MAINNNALGFKRGLQTSLNTLISNGGATEGIFYLTSDTNRLYIGKKDTDNKVYPVPVNQGVITVTRIEDLPSTDGELKKFVTGQFYYVSSNNLLCVYSGDRWVQINPDTYLKADTANITVSEKTDKTITITDTVKDDNGIETHTSTGSFGLTEGENITLTKQDKNIKIDSKDTIQSLSVEDVTIGKSSAIKISDKDSKIDLIPNIHNENFGTFDIKKTDDNTITFDLAIADQSVDSVVIEKGTSSNSTLKSGYKVKVKDKTGEEKSGTMNPTIKYGENYSSSQTFVDDIAKLDVYTKTEVKKLISDGFTAADAMTFKGVIEEKGGKIVFQGTNTEVSSRYPTVEAGDTYKVVDSDTYNPLGYSIFGVSGCKNGDLLIAKKDYKAATGTEPASGTTYTNGEWYLVQSGNDQIISSSVNTTNKSFNIAQNTEGNTATLLNATFKSDNNTINIEASVPDPVNAPKNIEFNFKHHDVSTSTGEDSSGDKTVVFGAENTETGTFKAITGIDVNNGHITKIKTSNFTVSDTHNTITKAGLSAAEETKSDGTISIKIYPDIAQSAPKGTTSINPLTLKSSTLDLDNSGTAGTNGRYPELSINLTWGTF